jgi:hypothetical protein
LPPSPLALQDITMLAREVVEHSHPSLAVVGTLGAGGGTGYAEVVLTLIGCHRDPCRTVVGIDRTLTRAEARFTLTQRIESHFQQPDRDTAIHG